MSTGCQQGETGQEGNLPGADSPSRLGRAGRPQPCPVEAASGAERWRALGGSAGFCARSEKERKTPTGLSDGGTAPVSDSSLTSNARMCVGESANQLHAGEIS